MVKKPYPNMIKWCGFVCQTCGHEWVLWSDVSKDLYYRYEEHEHDTETTHGSTRKHVKTTG